MTPASYQSGPLTDQAVIRSQRGIREKKVGIALRPEVSHIPHGFTPFYAKVKTIWCRLTAAK